MTLDLRRVLSCDNLPTLPNVAVKVLDLVRAPEPDVKQVISLIKSDPALAAKLLRTANSSLFAVRQQLSTIEQAVPLLGTVTVNSLVLSFSLTANSSQPGPIAEHYRRFWRCSMIQAVAADGLARRDRQGIPAEHFVAGLLQDVGVLALLRAVPSEYVPVLSDEEHEPQKSLAQVEQDRLGVTHVDVSVELCRRWKLPPPILEAIATHHLTPSEFRLLQHGASALSLALATAAAIAQYFCRSSKRGSRELVEDLAGRHFKLAGDSLHSFLDEIDCRVRQAADIFALDLGACPAYDEILSQANAELVQIALRAQVSSLQAGAAVEEAKRELAASEQEKEEIRRRAYRDPLTSAFNRRFFEMQLERECARCARYGESVGLVFVDVDHFKNLNDKYGHLFGDEVLRQVVRSMQSAVRDSDLVARFGGEEFVVLLLHISEQELLGTAERIRQCIEAVALQFAKQTVRVTASVGASLLASNKGPEEMHLRLIQAADCAMYQAKQSGRNQVRYRSCA